MTDANAAETTPPTYGEPLEPPPPKWPTVIGVVGIVLAAFGLFCGCVGYFSLPIQRWGVEMQAQSGQSNVVAEAQLRVAEQFQIFTYVLITLGLCMSLWLLLGSIALVRRRHKARARMIGWALTSLFLLVFNIAFQILMFKATAAELNRVNENGHVGELWISAVITGVFIVIFGMSFQILLLFWLSRAKIKAQVEQWR